MIGSTQTPRLTIHAPRLAILASKYDPTGTTTVRNGFALQMRKRFDWLRKVVWQVVVVEDCFRLRSPTPHVFASRPWVNPATGTTLPIFDFPSSSAKVDGFMEWLKGQEQAGILTTQAGPGLQVVGSQRWTDVYIESGYKKGLADAYSRGGYESVTGITSDQYMASSFFGPVHADPVGLLYTRSYNDLKGITEAMDQKISRTLAQGLADGWNPRRIGREISSAIDGIGKRRGQLLARTEVIRAHAEGSLNTYESFGLEGVVLEVEWSAAMDDRTCEECAFLSGQVFTIAEARGLIPLHPLCRCAWLPIERKVKAGKKAVPEGKAIPKGVPKEKTKPKPKEPAKKGLSLEEWRVLSSEERAKRLADELHILSTRNVGLSSKKFDEITSALGADMERMLANHPGLAKAFDEYTGRGVPLHELRLVNRGAIKGDTVALYQWKATNTGADHWSIHMGVKGRKSIPTLSLGRGAYTVAEGYGGIFRHEFGHWMHYRLFDITNVRRGLLPWDEFFASKPAWWWKENLSVYGASSTSEAWSEVVSAFTSPLYGTTPALTLPKELHSYMTSVLGDVRKATA